MRIPNPPQFNPTIQATHKFRFRSTAAFNLSVITSDLMQLLVIGTSATTTASAYSAFRLRKVKMWGPMAADLVPVTVSLEFLNAQANSGLGSRRTLHTDTSMGATESAYISASPEAESSAAAWQNVITASTNTNGCAFTISGPINTVIDVVLDIVMQNGEPPFVGATGTALVPGTWYGNSLDGGATGLLPPIGLVPLA
jgi:hypothetical protein